MIPGMTSEQVNKPADRHVVIYASIGTDAVTDTPQYKIMESVTDISYLSKNKYKNKNDLSRR